MPNSKSSSSSLKASSGTLKIVKKIQSNFRNRQKKTQKASTTIQKQFRKNKSFIILTQKLRAAEKKMYSNSRKIEELDKEIQLKKDSQYNLMQSNASKKVESKTDKGTLDNEVKRNAKELRTLEATQKRIENNQTRHKKKITILEKDLKKERDRKKTVRIEKLKETIKKEKLIKEEEKLRDMHNLLKSYLAKLTDLYNEKAKIDEKDSDSNQKIKTINKKVYNITNEKKYINAYNKINSSKYSEIISELEDIKNKIHELYKKDALTNKKVTDNQLTIQLTYEPLSVSRFIDSLKQCIANKSGGSSPLTIDRFNLLQFELTARDSFKNDGTKYFILKFNPSAFGINHTNVTAHLTIVDNNDLDTQGTHISIKTFDTHGNLSGEYRKYRNLSVNHSKVMWPRRLVPGMNLDDYKAILELMKAVNECLESGKELDTERIEVFNMAYGKKKKLIKKKKLTKKKRKLYRKK
tara:strand:- start:1651 stop:3048 length:1398 start_codon:yes stop_codon:yes gene_type:complete